MNDLMSAQILADFLELSSSASPSAWAGSELRRARTVLFGRGGDGARGIAESVFMDTARMHVKAHTIHRIVCLLLRPVQVHLWQHLCHSIDLTIVRITQAVR